MKQLKFIIAYIAVFICITLLLLFPLFPIKRPSQSAVDSYNIQKGQYILITNIKDDKQIFQYILDTDISVREYSDRLELWKDTECIEYIFEYTRVSIGPNS